MTLRLIGVSCVAMLDMGRLYCFLFSGQLDEAFNLLIQLILYVYTVHYGTSLSPAVSRTAG
jgi:hypothetical protein